VEHSAVLNTVEQLEQIYGFEVELLPVDRFGIVSEADLHALLREETAIVSVIYANNEIGSINPISKLAGICRERGVHFHTDAVQAASQLEIDVDALAIDLLAVGAHKFYGPKGVGALYVRSGTDLIPPLTGGGHEFGLRPGTHNVPLISGMARALGITASEKSIHNDQYRGLRDQLIETVLDSIPDARLTGHPSTRLPNHASFVFKGVDGNALLAALDLAGFACSSGSACKTGLPEPSPTLLALGLESDWAMGSLRVTVGRQTTQEQVEDFLQVLPGIVRRLRPDGLKDPAT
jgi:cysteine desulfurase